MRAPEVRGGIWVVSIALFALVALDTSALAQNRCDAGKLTASAKRVVCRLNAEAKGAKHGVSPDSATLQKCKDKFTKKFGTLDAKIGLGNAVDDCPAGRGDATAIGDRIDAFADDVVTVLGNGDASPNACAAGKEKHTDRKAACKLKVVAAAFRRNLPLDATKLARCEGKFAAGFDRLDAKNGDGNPSDACPNGTGDAGAIEQRVDDLVIRVASALADACVLAPTYTFTANGGDADRDVGWTGIVHDVPLPTNVRLAFCARCPAVGPCDQRELDGLVGRANGVAFAPRRCRFASNVVCLSDDDCGGGGPCVRFVGPPQPVPGPVSSCVLSYVTGPISGTVDPASGASAFTLDMLTDVYTGLTTPQPCPACTGGLCSGGIDNGVPCNVDGTSALYGYDVSFDCRLSAGAVIAGQWSRRLPMSTGAQSVTLASGSPACRATGEGGLKCICDTCNNAAGTVCQTDADCVAVGATICGGKRCIGGSDNGVPCGDNSECPGGACNVPGWPTAPNQCTDGVCTANTPPDNDSVNEGVCASGPFEMFCNLQPYRHCAVDADCPVSGDSCTNGRFRECFTDNGVVGASVSVAGVASPTAPTFGALFCNPPVSSSSVNGNTGLPGLGRWTIPGTATLN